MSELVYKEDEVRRKDSKPRELLMVPTSVKSLRTLTSHKRMGSTGTTGDESNTTDEDDDGDIDETDFNNTNFKQTDFFTNGFGSLSGISTITDKINHSTLMPRNSSDVSVYSGLEKCCDENVTSTTNNSENVGVSDCEYNRIDWAQPSAIEDVDNFTFVELKTSLRAAQRQLKDRKDEIRTLARLKHEVESELEDLTASLFQEAHNMVREANEKQAAAERALKESEMKVEVLMAEVTALKTLVITSTPSSPNPHLHPQIDKNKEEGVVIFSKKHNRSPSHSLKYGRGDSSPSPTEASCIENENNLHMDIEIDPILHYEFLLWKENPVFDKTSPFIRRIYEEDINLCLSFANTVLSEKVSEAVEKGIILIEAFGEKTKFPRNCALLEISRTCSYRMNLGDNSDNWYNISQICRNRITTVCDFLNYLKYIERGLVKSSVDDMYCEVIRLRKNMAIGRLGFQTSS